MVSLYRMSSVCYQSLMYRPHDFRISVSFYITESNTSIHFAADKEHKLQDLPGLRRIFDDTNVPHITVDENNTDTASHSRSSSISSSPAQPSPLSSIPNTPQLLHLSLHDEDFLDSEQSLAGLKDDLVCIHIFQKQRKQCPLTSY